MKKTTWRIIIALIVGLAIFGWCKFKNNNVRIPITTETWAGIRTDPYKERVEMDITDTNLVWLLATNGNIAHPIIMSATVGHVILGDNITRFQFSLYGGQCATKGEILLKRIKR
jgi:hypothetical protein